MLEIYLSENWAVVCDDEFDQRAADIACRQLGFPNVTSFGSDNMLSDRYKYITGRK